MKLYAHPFSSYSQKVLIALYENATPFDYRNLEELAANTELAALWPLKRFPVLLDDGRCILESSTIVAHLQAHHPGPICLIPPGDAGLEVHMLDRVFDNYVMTPMQKVALASRWPIAPPLPRSSTPTGPTRSPLAMAVCVPIAPVCSAIPPLCGWWMRPGHFGTTSRWGRQRVTEWNDAFLPTWCFDEPGEAGCDQPQGKTTIFTQVSEYAFMADISPRYF